jgi:phage terminase large subunit-like protein
LTNSSRNARQKKTDFAPRWLTTVPPADLKRSRGDFVIDFAEALCKITKDSVAGNAGQPMVFRQWQKDLTRQLFAVKADKSLRHRTALIGLPRKNGKSAWLAAVALEHLVFGPSGGEVYSCAADRAQAKIVFDTVKEMIRLQPDLAEFLQVFRDAIFNPKNGATYRALSAEAFTKEGLSPTLVAFDEVHAQPNRELWDVMQLAAGARTSPMMIGITTAGVKVDSSGKDSLCFGLYEYGKKVALGEVVDPTFFMSWWEAPEGMDHREPATWRAANPGFDDIVSAKDFESVVNRTPESEFRTKRCNQWVATSSTWLPAGAWDSVADSARVVPDGTDIVLAFDGSFNGDCTAIVGVTTDEIPHVFVVDAWEKPDGEAADWQVPVADVEQSIRDACARWQVREIACDPYRWARTFQVLEDEGLPVVLFPQSASRMTPATTRFFEAVLNRSLTQDADARLARHVGNATLKADARGSRLAKESRHSQRRIDLAVASVMGVERAAFWASQGNGLPMVFDPWSLDELGDFNE